MEDIMREIIEEIDSIKNEQTKIEMLKQRIASMKYKMRLIAEIRLPKALGEIHYEHLFPSRIFKKQSTQFYVGILDVKRGEFVELRELEVPDIKMKKEIDKSFNENPEWVLLSFSIIGKEKDSKKKEHFLIISLETGFIFPIDAPLFKGIRRLIKMMDEENIKWNEIADFYYLLMIDKKIGKDKITKIVEEYFRRKIEELKPKVKKHVKIREELAKLISEAPEYVV